MKKIILSAAILAGLAFVSCSKDDDKNNNCVTCTGNGDSQRVCKGDLSQSQYDDAIDTLEAVGYDCN